MAQEHQGQTVRLLDQRLLAVVAACSLGTCRPMGPWPGGVAPWVMGQLGLTWDRPWLEDSRCRRCLYRPRVVVRGAGAAGHDPGNGRRTVALNHQARARCDGDKRCCGCDEREGSDQSP